MGSLLTGVPLGSRSESTISPPPLYLGVILLRWLGLYACCPTPLPLRRPGPGWITSSTSCTPRGPLFTGMLVRVWRRESSLRPGKISLLLRRTTKRSALTLEMSREGKEMNTRASIHDYVLHVCII